jgi:hypothetical protein
VSHGFLSISMVSGIGMKNLFAKNSPDVHLSSETTLCLSALHDCYQTVRGAGTV